MSLTKEKCERALDIINSFINADEMTVEEFNNSSVIINELIKEHFKIVELLKKHKLENLSIEELDGWLGKLLWHVSKVNELSNKLFELSRDIKSKDEYITELRNYITQIEREFKDNPPLKFEELKPNMWVWDSKTKSYIFIFKPLNWEPTKGIRYANMIINHSADGYYIDFEENRLYRYEVKDDE